MNVPFVTFQYRDLKVFCVLHLQANRDFRKFITQARKKNHAVFEINQNKLISFLNPPGPLEKLLCLITARILHACSGVNLSFP